MKYFSVIVVEEKYISDNWIYGKKDQNKMNRNNKDVYNKVNIKSKVVALKCSQYYVFFYIKYIKT